MLIHRGQLFLRIAYAGAPLSGKTETLKALQTNLHGSNVGDAVFSPLSARGRTLYFDWVQYQGGTFLDGTLHCQITSVPGQSTLHRRRSLLIGEADVVVFVINSQRDQLEANQRSLAELKPWLERGDLPPVGVIYQANKRDLPGALAVGEIRAGLELGGETEVYESNALLGEGVRVCFVAAVRACVLRAEALRARGRLPKGEPKVTSGEQLLQSLRMAEDAESEPEAPALGEPAATVAPLPAPPAAAWARRPAVMPLAAWLANQAQGSARPAAMPEPAPPAPPVPAIEEKPASAPAVRPSRGAVVPIVDWRAGSSSPAPAPPTVAPPVPASAPAPAAAANSAAAPAPTVMASAAAGAGPQVLPAPWLPGREATLIEAWPPAIWHEVRLAANPLAEPPAASGGTLRGRIGAGWQARSWGMLRDLDAARSEFRRVVTWLERLGDVVSSRRCVVLCGGATGWCVWQVVRQELTFDLLIRQCLEQEQLSKYSVQVLARVATDFVLASQEFTLRTVELPIHFQTLAHENRSTVYSAFLPSAPVKVSNGDGLAVLAGELRAVIPEDLLRSANVTEALRELELLRETRPQLVPTVEVLQSLLIGE